MDIAKMNYVRIVGTAKRDSEATTLRTGMRKMFFTLLVPVAENARPMFVDCVALGEDIVDGQLEGFVDKGERFSVEGHLVFQTRTDASGNVRTGLMVEADSVEAI